MGRFRPVRPILPPMDVFNTPILVFNPITGIIGMLAFHFFLYKLFDPPHAFTAPLYLIIGWIASCVMYFKITSVTHHTHGTVSGLGPAILSIIIVPIIAMLVLIVLCLMAKPTLAFVLGCTIMTAGMGWGMFTLCDLIYKCEACETKWEFIEDNEIDSH